MNLCRPLFWGALLTRVLLALGTRSFGEGISPAPALLSCEASPAEDLGEWDDAWPIPEFEIIALRKDDQLYSLRLRGATEPLKLVGDPSLKDSKIYGAAAWEERLWLLLDSARLGPRAIDVRTGQIVEFSVPGIALPGGGAPKIQWARAIPHARGMLLELSGGAPWPRDENLPLYYWMSLDSGKTVALPIGWDLDYLTANEDLAVFETHADKGGFKRSPQAVEIATGALSNPAPNRGENPFITLDWTDRQKLVPVVEWRAGHTENAYFIGVAKDGEFLPFPLARNENIFTAEIKDCGEALALRVRNTGEAAAQPCPLWLLDSKSAKEPQMISDRSLAFSLLDGGNCLYTAGPKKKGAEYPEAFFRQEDGTTWNLLDGVDHPAKLPEKSPLREEMAIRLIEGSGDAGKRGLALCIFSLRRSDLRSNTPPEEAAAVKLQWDRAIIATSSGKRYMTNLFRTGTALPEDLWMHDSGCLITAAHVWEHLGEKAVIKVYLERYILDLDQK